MKINQETIIGIVILAILFAIVVRCCYQRIAHNLHREKKMQARHKYFQIEPTKRLTRKFEASYRGLQDIIQSSNQEISLLEQTFKNTLSNLQIKCQAGHHSDLDLQAQRLTKDSQRSKARGQLRILLQQNEIVTFKKQDSVSLLNGINFLPTENEEQTQIDSLIPIQR